MTESKEDSFYKKLSSKEKIALFSYNHEVPEKKCNLVWESYTAEEKKKEIADYIERKKSNG